jgi:hypothetical protein
MHDITPITTPIHIATVNGKSLRFFKSPVKDPDMPWFAVDDLPKCFELSRLAGMVLEIIKREPKWADVVRRISTADGVVTIAPHYMAQGFFGAAEQQGELSKSVLKTYLEAGVPATQKLLRDAGIKFGSPEMYAWVRQAIGELGDQAVLNPNTALFLALERYGEVVERDGERFIRMVVPDDGADEPPPPSPKPSGEMNLDVLLTATRDALRRSAIADPAAARELALDLAEVAFLERGRKEGDPPRATKAAHRTARGMVKLRHRFNPNVPGLGRDPTQVDDDPFKPSIDEKTGEEMFWVSEVGVWILMLERFEEVERFDNDPALTDFRKWLYVWREQVLTSNGGGR